MGKRNWQWLVRAERVVSEILWLMIFSGCLVMIKV